MKLKSRNSLPSDKEARAGCLSLPANNGIIRALLPPFTGINIRLFAALGLLSLSGAAAQASVYHCNSNGKSVYTSAPAGSCADADLPKISSHQSKKKNKKPAGKKNKQAAKAPKENQKQTTEKKSP
ncbi:DUF4124 domain-containing protein [Neisseria meningitidis]|uniref:DUF4124 domain-containing protein n=1 Tax=Neisseria meningitidis TaxID=487 RepID=UPI001E4342E8|nr:DUF4124 domain-containing protein [Neisseria meningitidis]